MPRGFFERHRHPASPAMMMLGMMMMLGLTSTAQIVIISHKMSHSHGV
jgi:hypothetical protein